MHARILTFFAFRSRDHLVDVTPLFEVVLAPSFQVSSSESITACVLLSPLPMAGGNQQHPPPPDEITKNNVRTPSCRPPNDYWHPTNRSSRSIGGAVKPDPRTGMRMQQHHHHQLRRQYPW